MTDHDSNLARALQRVLEDHEFLEQVVADPATALASYELNDEETAAITADAVALEGDVSGFGRLTFNQVIAIGGLHTPRLLGFGTATVMPTQVITYTHTI